MANVSIYQEHRDILDALITSGKVKSVAGATKTGPFREQRDAYVFAAAIALANGCSYAEEDMPKSRAGVTTIRDSVFLGADGAEEISCAVVLVSDPGAESTEEDLAIQLRLLSDNELAERLALLDRYAYAGFEWLRQREKDETGVRDLILGALDDIDCEEVTESDTAHITDPLLDVLLD